MPRAPVALYIHVPFCLSLCPYCDFVVYAGAAAIWPQNRIEAFLGALHVELDLRADVVEQQFGDTWPALGSVYLGGGTPSLLGAAAVAALLDHVERRFGIAPDAEITLEVNPGPRDRGDLAGFRAAGVTRLSLGVQSLDAAELRALGRRHLPGDVATAVAEARAAGFANLSLDLLYDVPGQTLASWRATLERALDLAPEHLSTYALTLDLDATTASDRLPATRGSRAWRGRAVAAQDQDRAADMDALADAVLEPAGFARYEIANRAQPGHQSRHNLAYWQRLPYEALGPGAHAFDGDRVRRWNAANLGGYLAALAPTGTAFPVLPPGEEDRLDAQEAEFERAILGLRLATGVPADLLAEPATADALAWGLEVDLLERVGDRLRLTPGGRLLSNELFARLLPTPARRPQQASAPDARPAPAPGPPSARPSGIRSAA